MQGGQAHVAPTYKQLYNQALPIGALVRTLFGLFL